jgi:hypothetical protein
VHNRLGHAVEKGTDRDGKPVPFFSFLLLIA